MALMRKDSVTHMHGLAVNMIEVLPFAQDVLLPLLIPFLNFIQVFTAISSNIDEVLSINPSANMFFFRDFNIQHKDWLT